VIQASLSPRIDQVIELRDREIALRERARLIELNPSRCEEARAIFAHASLLRRRRMALLNKCGLL